MGQVIQVQLLNPETSEKLIDRITLTSEKSNPTDHTEAHREAVGLALRAGLGDAGTVTISEMRRDEGPEAAGSGSTTCWRYIYTCTIKVEGDEVERDVVAVLYAQYKERANSPERTQKS